MATPGAREGATANPEASDGDTETSGEARSRPPIANDADEDLQPPGPGQSAWFGAIEIRYRKPSRPDDSPSFTTIRGLQRLRESDWNSALALARKICGDPLPRPELRATRDPTVVSAGASDVGWRSHG